jgi:uncharacterized protein (DUF1330 family)
MPVFTIGKVYDITDWDSYNEYKKKALFLYEKHMVKTIVCPQKDEYEIVSPEGGNNPDVVNIFMFPDKQRLFDFYYSEEYQKLIKERDKFCRVELTFVYDKEQGFEYD